MQTAELKASDTSRLFGVAVAISGTTAIVGADSPLNGGRAFVFSGLGSTWKQTAELKGSGVAGGQAYSFGNAVGISGSQAVVGSGFSGAYLGYLFTETPTGWKQVLVANHTGLTFGNSVAISGTTAMIGMGSNTELAGRVFVYTERGTAWTESATLKGSDTVGFDEFGCSVSLSGNYAIVGADSHDKLAGRAYLFVRSGTVWRQVAEMKGSDTVAHDMFGLTTAIVGSIAVVGAPQARSAYVFEV